MSEIMHRFLQPANILVSYPNGSDPPRLKLGHFGFIRVSSSNFPLWKQIASSGTNEKWMAPEIYDEEQQEFTIEMDLFAAGCLFGYSQSGGRHVFQAENEEATVKRIMKKMPMTLKAEHLKNAGDGDAKEILNIIHSMVNPEPLLRPSTSNILKMPFFKKSAGGEKKRQSIDEEEQPAKRNKPNATAEAPTTNAQEVAQLTQSKPLIYFYFPFLFMLSFSC